MELGVRSVELGVKKSLRIFFEFYLLITKIKIYEEKYCSR